MESHKKCRCCNICGQELDKLPVQSPMVNDELWDNILNFYGLSEHRLQPKSPAQTPVFVCTDCMSRALDRNISLDDLANVPFNLDFILYHFYKVPLCTIIKIHKYIYKLMSNAPQLSPPRLQREMDFMNGVLMPFIAPECACAIPLKEHFQTQILSQFSDDDLKKELKRRENERRSRFF